MRTRLPYVIWLRGVRIFIAQIAPSSMLVTRMSRLTSAYLLHNYNHRWAAECDQSARLNSFLPSVRWPEDLSMTISIIPMPFEN